jgi:hypothetical protein
MTIHKCARCGYETKVHTNYKNHLNRKKPCSNSPNSAPTAPNSAPTAPNSAPTAPNSAPTAPNSAPINSKQCKYCSKVFSRPSVMKKHILMNRCKLNKLSTILEYANEDESEIEYVVEDEDMKNESLIMSKIKSMEEIIKSQSEAINELKSKPNIVNNIQNNHLHVYCVIMDEKTIEDIFKNHFNKEIFYNGPAAGITLLYKILFRKDILLLDSGRQIFQYKTIPEDETSERVIKDIKNYRALTNIGKSYEKYVKIMMLEEMQKHPTDGLRQESIFDIAQSHIKMINNDNIWSNVWSKVVGK